MNYKKFGCGMVNRYILILITAIMLISCGVATAGMFDYITGKNVTIYNPSDGKMYTGSVLFAQNIGFNSFVWLENGNNTTRVFNMDYVYEILS
jgi:hypothetical protein